MRLPTPGEIWQEAQRKAGIMPKPLPPREKEPWEAIDDELNKRIIIAYARPTDVEAALRYYDRVAVGERLLLAYELAREHRLPQEYEFRECLKRFFPAKLDRLETEEEEENDDEQMLPVNEVITAVALARRWAEKRKDIALLRKDIELLRTRYDLEEVEEAMDEYEDIERGDYDNAEEYQDARNEAWEAILDTLYDVEEEEENDDEQMLPINNPKPPIILIDEENDRRLVLYI